MRLTDRHSNPAIICPARGGDPVLTNICLSPKFSWAKKEIDQPESNK